MAAFITITVKCECLLFIVYCLLFIVYCLLFLCFFVSFSSVWLVIVLVGFAAFVYTVIDCVSQYLSEPYYTTYTERPGVGEGRLPRLTICNLNPLR